MAKSSVPLEKVTLNLFKGDKDTLAAFYPSRGWSVAAREIIEDHCAALRAEEAQKLERKHIEVDVDLTPLEQ